MDFEVDMLKFWVEQLMELLPEPSEELMLEIQSLVEASERSFPRSR